MKRFCLIGSIFLILLLLVGQQAYAAGIYKWVNVGSFWAKVFDNGHQSETEGGNDAARYYYDGHQNPNRSFSRFYFRNNGTRIGVKNWTSEDGTFYPVRLAGAPFGTSDAVMIMPTLPDENGITIHRYFRYEPPKIVVDGKILHDPFPFDDGDHVDPDYNPGTADIMIESRMRTWIGLDVHQRVYGWSQANHDDYAIYDLVFKNTGNVDLDDEIELPNQTLEGLYIQREIGCQPGAGRDKEWSSWYGSRPGDSLRIMYNYSCRTHNSTIDDFGHPRDDQGSIRLAAPGYGGEATLFVSSDNNDMVNDDPAQPQMHTIWSYRLLYLKEHSLRHSPSEWELAYDVMQRGLWPQYGQPLMEGTYPGTFHEVPPDERGIKTIRDFEGWGTAWHSIVFNSVGPYNLAPGDSIRLVYALVAGSISKQKGFEIAKAWYNGKCVWQGEDNLPPQYQAFPELYNNDPNDWAKDCWVATGKDSLFKNASAAQWAKRQNFNVPIPPPPPDIEVTSMPDRIEIQWDGTQSESVSDFAGYRVYRCTGTYHDSAFVKIFECGKGTDNPTVVHSYDDRSAVRGTSYYYYVAAFDDGLSNGSDFDGVVRSLESGKFSNMTTQPALLARPPGASLDDIVVVPNPFNLKAEDLQFPGDRNRIIFYNVPAECTIRIFSESGDLVKTIEHTAGSGDAAWGILQNEQQTTNTGQIPVSGIYIANISTPAGESKNVKFLIVR